jgi:hypothetical protein
MLVLLLLSATGVFLATVAAFISANVIRRRWLKFGLRAAGVCGVLVLTAGVCMVTWLARQSPETEYRIVTSPDGLREAITTYTPGFLGRDVLTVEIKSQGEPWTFKAFEYFGASSIDWTTVRWPDNRHVEIFYHSAYYGVHGYCASPAADLTVTCTPLANGRTSD